MEADIGAILPQDKEHLGLPEAVRDKEGPSSGDFKESVHLLIS